MEELKYKVGDEVLIKAKITETNDPAVRMYPYRVMYEYNNIALTWGENVTETSIAGKVEEFVKVSDQKTYEQGLNDAWEMAKLITLMPHDGGASSIELMDAYSIENTYAILKQYSAQEAIDKYNTWKERNTLKMGDIVEIECDGNTELAIFYCELDTCYWVLSNGSLAPQLLHKHLHTLRKIGESGLDIAGALAKIRDEED